MTRFWEKLNVIKIYGRSCITINDCGIGVLSGGDLKTLGIKLLNSIFVMYGMPFAVLAIMKDDGDKVEFTNPNSFYLLTASREVLCPVKDGFSIFRGKKFDYTVSNTVNLDPVYVDRNGEVSHDQNLCYNITRF
jgi:hypothetical protein